MLRNVHRCNHHLLHVEWNGSKGHARFSTACKGATYAKADSIKFQSKVMSKLVGQRISGSKKRWYPNSDGNTSNSIRQHKAEMFNSAYIAKPTAGKNTTRRMVVLNKLFMKHITDLLATGEASEAVLGRGLQVTRVKISPDFACINVYWLGSGVPLNDALLETELQRCAGILRHELSQLMLMSEVPRVQFAREKKLANIAQVEQLLRTIDLSSPEEVGAGDEVVAREGVEHTNYNLLANMMQREFYGKHVLDLNENVDGEAEEEHFPEMRHDVLGLDHRHIMSKLMTKMRKSQQAWEQHTQKTNMTDSEMAGPSESLERVQQKLAAAAAQAEGFEKFLAKRCERKSTPERKRHDRALEWIDERAEQMTAEAAADAVLTPTQRKLLEAEDYLYEDDDKSEPNKK
ncbi:uncharacterized protein LOC128858920 [Anastrepha ludens]|uniref:uncharacterized protein LOC128858920 n=1 Tax=Anastrepha ludens TaxID=28586 RepID=UPI0023AE6E24|nr:uncharacterized protein LOC128858920 [Anastrepha ludens]